jgi:L-alanine-DL-glutamate epimerase-like enolase superfamily enzyme
VILRITDGDHFGWGEAAPIDGYSEATLDQCEDALRDQLVGLSACDPDDPDSTLNALSYPLPSNARAALECALRDLAARRSGRSLVETLGGVAGAQVELRALLAGTDAADLRDAALNAKDAGFESFKIKLGRNPDSDLRAAQAVRVAIGSDAHLSGDPNACWAESEAPARLKALHGIVNLVEQPVEGVTGVRRLLGNGIPLALDEAATAHDGLDDPRPADAACLKVQAFGGIDKTIEAAIRARQSGMQVLIGSTLEGAVGMAASFVAAQIVKPDLASGLSTLSLFSEDFDAFPNNGPFGSAPLGIGLGTDPDGTLC